jgi:hypothetical protein
LVEAGVCGKNIIFHVADADLIWCMGALKVVENGHTAVHHIEGSCVAHEDGEGKSGVGFQKGGDMGRIIEANGEGVVVAVFAEVEHRKVEQAMLFEGAVDMFIGKDEVTAGVVVDDDVVLVIEGVED